MNAILCFNLTHYGYAMSAHIARESGWVAVVPLKNSGSRSGPNIGRGFPAVISPTAMKAGQATTENQLRRAGYHLRLFGPAPSRRLIDRLDGMIDRCLKRFAGERPQVYFAVHVPSGFRPQENCRCLLISTNGIERVRIGQHERGVVPHHDRAVCSHVSTSTEQHPDRLFVRRAG